MAPKLYDLVAKAGQGGPYWSPNTVKARLSLLTKKCDFEIVDTTFKDCRKSFVGEKFGANPSAGKPTVPVLELEDGRGVVDSIEIALYLDKTYPSVRSIFAPEISLPIDQSSAEYVAAVESTREFVKDAMSGFNPLFALCVKQIHNALPNDGEDSDYEYFTSDKKFGKVWDKMAAFDDATLLPMAHKRLSTVLGSIGNGFLSSPSEPGFKDFVVFGGYTSLRCVRPDIATKVWVEGSPEAASWLKRMLAKYPQISDIWKAAA